MARPLRIEFGNAMRPVSARGTARRAILLDLAAHLLGKYAGLTQRQVAETLGLRTGAAVSIQLKNLRETLARDRRLQETLAQAEKRLESLADAAKAERRPGSY